jgi:hypothetical protein
VNYIYEALQLGTIVCYADNSYLVFQWDSLDEVCKIARGETTCVADWLQDVGMEFNWNENGWVEGLICWL